MYAGTYRCRREIRDDALVCAHGAQYRACPSSKCPGGVVAPRGRTQEASPVPAASSQEGPTPDAAAMRVVGYVRVSTDEQGVERPRPRGPAGRDQRRVQPARLGARPVRRGRPGAARSIRPGLNAALEPVAAGEVDGLVVSKLDRLSRSVVDFSGLLEDARRRGCTRGPRPRHRPSTTHGEATATSSRRLAQVERRIIGQRTRRRSR